MSSLSAFLDEHAAKIMVFWWTVSVATCIPNVLRWSSQFSKWAARRPDGEDFDVHFEIDVEKEVNGRLETHVKTFAQGILVDLPTILMIVPLMEIGRGAQRSLTMRQELTCLSATILGTLLRLFPQFLDLRFADWWLTGLFLGIIFCLTDPEMGPGAHGFLEASIASCIPRAIVFMGFCRMSTAMLCTMALVIAQQWVLVLLGTADPPEAGEAPVGGLGPGKVYAMYSAFEGCLLIGLLAAYSLSNRLLWVESRTSVQLRNADSKIASLKSLLGVCCDSVLEVDQALQILEHDAGCTALLGLKQDESLVGKSLTSYMHSRIDVSLLVCALHKAYGVPHFGSQAENMVELLARKGCGGGESADGEADAPGRLPGAGPPAGTSPARLRTADGTTFDVELLYVIHHTYDNGRRYLIGMRKVSNAVAETQRLAAAAAWGTIRGRADAANAGQAALQSSQPAAVGGNKAAASSPVSQPPSAPAALAASRTRVPAGDQGGPAQLLASDFKPTRVDTQELMLVQTMLQWNSHVPSAACCPFHGALEHLQTIADKVQGRECIPNFRPPANSQCTKCGALATWDSAESNSCQACALWSTGDPMRPQQFLVCGPSSLRSRGTRKKR